VQGALSIVEFVYFFAGGGLEEGGDKAMNERGDARIEAAGAIGQGEAQVLKIALISIL